MSAPKAINPDEWQRIVSVYAKHEGRMHPTADELGWPIARTRRLWNRGYPSIGYPPIKNICAADQFSAAEIRAERQMMESKLSMSAPSVEAMTRSNVPESEQAVVISSAEQVRIKEMVRREEERDQARRDSLKAKGEEATLIQINRRNAIALNLMTAQVLKGATKLSGRIQRALEREAESGSMTVQEQMHLVRAAASIMRFNSEASVMAVKAERMVLNTPIDTGSDVSPDAAKDAVADAVAWIEKASKAVQRAQARGLLVSGKKG